MNGQISIFDILQEKEPPKAGTWIESDMLGEQMTFDEIAESIGKLIVMDLSTVSHAWYKVVLVEKIIEYEGTRRLIYYDGVKQRGYVSEIYFDESMTYPARAYRLKM